MRFTQPDALTGLPTALLALLLLLSFNAPVSAQSFASTGLTVVLNNVPYYIPPYPAGRVSANASDLSTLPSVNGFYPITVLADPISANDFPALIENFSAVDDVFQSGFLQGIPPLLSLL